MPSNIPNWLVFQQRVDKIVDTRFAEKVELHPWTGGGYSSDGMPDIARSIVRTMAVFVTPGAAIVGEAGTAHGSQQLENDTWISIQEDLLGDPSTWKAYDRVYLPYRDFWFAIIYVAPSATRRPNIYLTRLTSARTLTGPQHKLIAQAQVTPFVTKYVTDRT